MRINKKGRVNGTHSQHRVSLMVDDDNWAWYCNLKNKARAINDLMKTQIFRERMNKMLFKEEDSQ